MTQRTTSTVAIAVAATVVLVGGSVPTAAGKKVAIFVTSIGAAPGMTDPNKDNQVATEDLAALVDDQPQLKTVKRRENAKIVLVVQSSEYVDVPGNPALESRITARLVSARTELIFAGVGHLRVPGIDPQMLRALAARAVARQVNDWVAANRTAIE
jgi:hypothetical protein